MSDEIQLWSGVITEVEEITPDIRSFLIELTDFGWALEEHEIARMRFNVRGPFDLTPGEQVSFILRKCQEVKGG